MPDSPLGQSEARPKFSNSSTLYDKAKAVVDACEEHLERPWNDRIGEAVIALRHELAEIDKALEVLAELRAAQPTEPPTREEMLGDG